MRNSYPISSFEINDQLLLAYENMVYLLGVKTDTLDVTGLYDQLDNSGVSFMTNTSGIPHVGTNDSQYGYELGLSYDTTTTVIVSYLRADYLLRKHLGVI